MQTIGSQIAYDTLVDTGVSLRVRLDTNPVSLIEAHALLTFLDEALQAQISAWEEIHGHLGLVPVIELRSGSIEAIIRFMKEKTKDGKEFAMEMARDFAKDVVKGMIAAMLTLPGNAGEPVEPPNLPHQVIQCNDTIYRNMEDLVRILQHSGKPYKLEVSCGHIVIQGNQPESNPQQKSFKSTSGGFIL